MVAEVEGGDAAVAWSGEKFGIGQERRDDLKRVNDIEKATLESSNVPVAMEARQGLATE